MMEKSFSKKIISRTADFLNQNSIPKSASILCAVSGGLDSVCLLHIFTELAKQEDNSYKIFAVHINHGIRGEMAKRDAEFVEALAHEYNVPLKSYRYDVPAMARAGRQSIEEAGRAARYEGFQRAAQEFEADVVAMAHHADDAVETFIFNMLRGSRLNGLLGISFVRGKYIRPLIDMRKSELVRYAEENMLTHIEDETNNYSEYTRNYIRNELIPGFYRVNRGAVDNINAVINELQGLYQLLSPMIASAKSDVVKELKDNYISINISRAAKYDRRLLGYVISELISEAGFSKKNLVSKHYEGIIYLLSAVTGRRIELPNKITAKREYDRLIIYKNDTDICDAATPDVQACYKIDLSSLNDLGLSLKFDMYDFYIELVSIDSSKLPQDMEGSDAARGINAGDCAADKPDTVHRIEYFDVDELDMNEPIDIRYRLPDDYMVIDAAGNKKRLNRLFIDHKIPADLRDRLPVISQGDRVLYVAALRRSRDAWLKPDTKRALKICIIYNEY